MNLFSACLRLCCWLGCTLWLLLLCFPLRPWVRRLGESGVVVALGALLAFIDALAWSWWSHDVQSQRSPHPWTLMFVWLLCCCLMAYGRIRARYAVHAHNRASSVYSRMRYVVSIRPRLAGRALVARKEACHLLLLLAQ